MGRVGIRHRGAWGLLESLAGARGLANVGNVADDQPAESVITVPGHRRWLHWPGGLIPLDPEVAAVLRLVVAALVLSVLFSVLK